MQDVHYSSKLGFGDFTGFFHSFSSLTSDSTNSQWLEMLDRVDVPIHYLYKHVGRIGWLTSRKRNLPTMYWRLRKLNTAWLWDFSHCRKTCGIHIETSSFSIPPRVIAESRCKIVFFVSAKIKLKEHHRSNLPSSVIELYAKTRMHFFRWAGGWSGLQVAQVPPMYQFTRALWLNPLVWVERSTFIRE